MTDELIPDVIAARPLVKNPNLIRVTFELPRAMNRFERREFRNLQKSPTDDTPRFKIHKGAAIFTAVGPRDGIEHHVDDVRSVFGQVQHAGEKRRAEYEQSRDEIDKKLGLSRR